ncbi:MAG: hypothetical protein ACKERG_01070 [Candidatus Hodgkinia cicadicola]
MRATHTMCERWESRTELNLRAASPWNLKPTKVQAVTSIEGVNSWSFRGCESKIWFVGKSNWAEKRYEESGLWCGSYGRFAGERRWTKTSTGLKFQRESCSILLGT